MDVNMTIDKPQFAIHHPSRETMPLPPGKKFHIFFSYTNVLRDKLWVKRVVDKLETEYGYTCCDHERDFLPGTTIMDNIKDGVKNSGKVVVVFSKEAIDSHYVSLEARMAYQLSLERRENLVIPVLLDDCDVPEEYLLLTYIDAREGIEEATWWPKLIMSINSTGETSRLPFHVEGKPVAGETSRLPFHVEGKPVAGEASRLPFHVEGKPVAAGKLFALSRICSIETKYNFCRCRSEGNCKYIPKNLQSEAIGVPLDLIQATYKDLLHSRRVVCRQKCYCFARILVVFGCKIFIGLLILCCIPMFYCVTLAGENSKTVCIMYVSACFSLPLIFGVCCLGCRNYYVKKPDSVHKKIIDYNRILSKYGVMVTVVPRHMWKTASEYVLHHLVKEESSGTTESRYIPDSNPMIAPTDDSPLLSGARELHGSREVDSSTQCAHAASQTYANSCYLGMDDESHDFETIFNAEEDSVQSIPTVNAINPVTTEEADDVSDVADDKPLLSNQQRENLDYEKKALELLMSCTPGYLDRANDGELKNTEEDRHGTELLCLCQYLEEVDMDFREKVKRTKSLRLKTGIEENYQDEAIAHFKSILLN